MPAFAPRIGPPLLAELERLDDGSMRYAELCRRVGDAAERLGVTRPSYQRVRTLAHQLRRLRKRPTTTDVLLDIAFRVRPPTALGDHLAGLELPTPRM